MDPFWLFQICSISVGLSYYSMIIEESGFCQCSINRRTCANFFMLGVCEQGWDPSISFKVTNLKLLRRWSYFIFNSDVFRFIRVRNLNHNRIWLYKSESWSMLKIKDALWYILLAKYEQFEFLLTMSEEHFFECFVFHIKVYICNTMVQMSEK